MWSLSFFSFLLVPSRYLLSCRGARISRLITTYEPRWIRSSYLVRSKAVVKGYNMIILLPLLSLFIFHCLTSNGPKSPKISVFPPKFTLSFRIPSLFTHSSWFHSFFLFISSYIRFQTTLRLKTPPQDTPPSSSLFWTFSSFTYYLLFPLSLLPSSCGLPTHSLLHYFTIIRNVKWGGLVSSL